MSGSDNIDDETTLGFTNTAQDLFKDFFQDETWNLNNSFDLTAIEIMKDLTGSDPTHQRQEYHTYMAQDQWDEELTNLFEFGANIVDPFAIPSSSMEITSNFFAQDLQTAEKISPEVELLNQSFIPGVHLTTQANAYDAASILLSPSTFFSQHRPKSSKRKREEPTILAGTSTPATSPITPLEETLPRLPTLSFSQPTKDTRRFTPIYSLVPPPLSSQRNLSPYNPSLPNSRPGFQMVSSNSGITATSSMPGAYIPDNLGNSVSNQQEWANLHQTPRKTDHSEQVLGYSERKFSRTDNTDHQLSHNVSDVANTLPFSVFRNAITLNAHQVNQGLASKGRIEKNPTQNTASINTIFKRS